MKLLFGKKCMSISRSGHDMWVLRDGEFLGLLNDSKSGEWIFTNFGFEEEALGITNFSASELRQLADKLDELNAENE